MPVLLDDPDRRGNEAAVVRRTGPVRKVQGIFEPDPDIVAALHRRLENRPGRASLTVEHARQADAMTVEHRSDGIARRDRLGRGVFPRFDQDAHAALGRSAVHERLRIGDRPQPGLDADLFGRQRVAQVRRPGLRKVD